MRGLRYRARVPERRVTGRVALRLPLPPGEGRGEGPGLRPRNKKRPSRPGDLPTQHKLFTTPGQPPSAVIAPVPSACSHPPPLHASVSLRIIFIHESSGLAVWSARSKPA